MTIEEAKTDINDIDSFCRMVCDQCISNDWYCPSECNALLRARRIPFEKILGKYAFYDGDLWKVLRYIKSSKKCEVGE